MLLLGDRKKGVEHVKDSAPTVNSWGRRVTENGHLKKT